MITGILPVDKPLGWTSHDVVGRIRRVAGQRQVGHAGTLDPLATGVLVLVLGQATRLSAYLMGSEKEYGATVVLGATTATDDAEAPMLEARDASGIDRSSIEAVLHRFLGTTDQTPPRYAAVRKGGEKLYVLARRGEQVEIEPRRVTIHEILIEGWDSPVLRLRVRCESGTYIRALARDIGEALGVGGYLHALRRTASGSFRIGDCAVIDRLQGVEDLRCALAPPDRAVIEWPALVVGGEDAVGVRYGRRFSCDSPVHGSIRIYSRDGALVALGESDGNSIKPFRVFGGGPDASGH